jgi:type II secretory pathway pseudopilin PulG
VVRPPNLHRASNESLIEIFLVISIISALATVAIPRFLQFVNTSKRSETDVMFRAIHDAVLDYLAQNNDRFPTDLGGGATSITANWNPAVFSGAKKPWLTGQPGWNLLAWEPLSYGYHSYHLYDYTSPALTASSRTVFSSGSSSGPTGR